MSHTKCTKHQIYDCTVCPEFEGPVARARRQETEITRLKALVKSAERAGGLSGNTPPYVLGCPWCLSAPNEFGLRHASVCPAFTPDGDVR